MVQQEVSSQQPLPAGNPVNTLEQAVAPHCDSDEQTTYRSIGTTPDSIVLYINRVVSRNEPIEAEAVLTIIEQQRCEWGVEPLIDLKDSFVKLIDALSRVKEGGLIAVPAEIPESLHKVVTGIKPMIERTWQESPQLDKESNIIRSETD